MRETSLIDNGPHVSESLHEVFIAIAPTPRHSAMRSIGERTAMLGAVSSLAHEAPYGMAVHTTTHHGSGLAPVYIAMHQPHMTVDTL
jgi:hypothetical protein